MLFKICTGRFMKSFRLAHIIPLVIILIASVYYLGGARVKQEDHRYWPGREELFERLFNERRLLFVYGASRPEFAARYQAFAENYKNRSRRLSVTIKSDRETTSEDLKNNAVYLVGTPASNHWLRKLSARLPVKFEDGGFEFFGKAYRDSSDVISLFYPNPENPQLPLQVLSGNREEEVLAFELFRQSSDYRIVRHGNCIALGSFAQEEGRRWAFDSANHHDFAAETKLAKETAHFRFHTHGFALPAEELDRLASTCEQNYQRLAAFFGNAAVLPAIDYHLYATFEEKGLITSNTQLAHCDLPRREVHVMLGDWISGTQAAKPVCAFTSRRIGGSAAMPFGPASFFSPAICRRWRICSIIGCSNSNPIWSWNRWPPRWWRFCWNVGAGKNSCKTTRDGPLHRTKQRHSKQTGTSSSPR
ncbi:hypothetical protein DCC62_25945 [candidate division KSB1 bacterium]|nr:MAG: hypothetical protein DCC62_25945 [candidate division KSB1 bacterium]